MPSVPHPEQVITWFTVHGAFRVPLDARHIQFVCCWNLLLGRCCTPVHIFTLIMADGYCRAVIAVMRIPTDGYRHGREPALCTAPPPPLCCHLLFCCNDILPAAVPAWFTDFATAVLYTDYGRLRFGRCRYWLYLRDLCFCGRFTCRTPRMHTHADIFRFAGLPGSRSTATFLGSSGFMRFSAVISVIPFCTHHCYVYYVQLTTFPLCRLFYP